MFTKSLRASLILPFSLCLAVRAAEPAPDSEAYFNQFVRPVLESSCTHCHGAQEAKGDLRLDSLEAALKGGEGGTALVPGDPDKSPLYTTTVLAPSHDDIMPPSKEPPLTKLQTDKLRDWIKAGAKWPAGVTLATEPRMQFVRDIQPILEQNCVACHKADKNEGGLDMTTWANNIKGGDSSPSITPFDEKASLSLVRALLPADDDDVMPPKKKNSGGPLPKEMLTRLQLWIKQGAAWPEGVVLVQKAKSEERPPSPDNVDLAVKIHAFITEKSPEKTAADMKPYKGIVPKISKDYSMVVIPGGEFMMGSPAGEKDRKEDEGPQVKVQIEPFWMGAHEITWELYMPFMVTDDARYKDGAKKDPKAGDTIVDAVSSPTTPYTDMTFGMGQDGFPAISMTEHAALKYCQWLSAQTGHFYRLPTEAEWEYAARAGTTTAYFWGDDAAQMGDYAWFLDNADGKTQPVGKKKPNPWGLYDIAGNCTEWTLDQYDPAFYASLTAGVVGPWNAPKTIYPRAVRGGSWDDDPKDLRSAARRGSKDVWKVQDPQLPKSLWYHTNAQFLGFRLVRPLKVPPPAEMHHIWALGLKNDGK